MLKVAALSKSFQTGDGELQAVGDVSFDVPQGRCFALLGPSGCGKTTVLRCVAGLERPERGTIEIGGQPVADARNGVSVPVHQRSIGMVFQSYAIWPHLDVFENVAYPLRVQRRPRPSKAEIERRVADALALVDLAAMARRPAPRLSGGQQQRVALARAIIRRPALLLLDEPLSNLDARLRDAMRRELSTLIRKIGITALFVTHDQVEALSIADHVAVMDAGRIVQEGTPFEIYDRPKSLFVARFLGATNVLRGSVEASDSEGKALIVLDRGHRLLLCTDCEPGEPVDIALRPDCLALRTGAPDASLNSLQGSVASLSFQGGHIEYEVEVDGGARLRVHTGTQSPIGPGHAVYLSIDPARAMVFKRV